MNNSKTMVQNVAGNRNFSKLKEVPEDSIEAKLFQIIDDIGTAMDMFKPNIENYERYVDKKIKASQEHIVSDGYKLYYA